MQLQNYLKERGYLYQHSHEAIFEKLDKGGVGFYCGFDPTADSLHMGNFIGFMTAVQLMLRGNKYYALVGGATGMVGDPGGKDAERTFLDEETLTYNVGAIKNQFETILARLAQTTGKELNFEIVNNLDFYKGVGYLDFLREVGKYHTVNQMIAKDTVKKRIEDPTKSISYTEFSYMLLQGFDYYCLNRDHGVELQVGGQDQWGNLVTGIELIRKKTEAETYTFTWPLITDATGRKFGKSEGNALFLDRNKTSPYDLYQYFMNAHDDDIERYLKLLTLLELNDIDDIVSEHKLSPELRVGQKKLAYEVVNIIHGESDAESCQKITEFLFGSGDKIELLKGLNEDEFQIFFTEIGGIEYSDQNLFGMFIESELEQSGGTARQTLSGGAMFINEVKIEDGHYDFSGDFINGSFLLLRKGKKNFRIVKK
ncbi:tyrosine--tRNA ligase [Candidatus Gracilibacteria bacterium]|nr:tyrosine--tRNA ligase [Candidatus Gracilibacteria bacterium]